MRYGNNVSETTTSIAGTNGDGAVTLTQRTNLPRFSTVFGTQATTVRYVIRQSDNTKFETGIGSVSSNVLTRTRPQVTWDGTTYDDSTPSALQFGSSPSSGTVLIEMSATAEGLAPVITGMQSTVAGDATWRDYPISGNYEWSGGGSGMTLTADREYYNLYRNDRAGLLVGAQMEVTTSVASSNIKWALYSLGYDQMPAAKIVDFVTQSAASTGVKTDTATGSWTPAGPVWLVPGWYAIGFISGHAPAMRRTSSTIYCLVPSAWGRKSNYGYINQIYVSGNYTTGLPAVPSLGSGTSVYDQLMWIGLKIQG